MRPAQRQVQKAQRIEQRLRGVPEGLEQDLEGDFGGARTFSVATHAVHHDQQCGMLGDGHRHPVLVLLPAAREGSNRRIQPARNCSVCLVHCGESYITRIAGGIRRDRAASCKTTTGLSLIQDPL